MKPDITLITLPCKQCLKYAICIGRSQLSCDDVHDYFNDVHDTIKKEMKIDKQSVVELELRNEAWDKAWIVVQYHLPNIKGLFRGEKNQKMPNTTDPNYKPNYARARLTCRR